MNKKTVLEKIKQLFTDTEEEVEVSFVDVKTEDGRILRLDDIAVDQAVKEITEDGEVEIEDGTYVLEDGNSLVVSGGIITEIIEAEAEAEEEVEEVVAEEMAEEEAEVSVEENPFEVAVLSALEELKSKFEVVEKENNELKEKFEAFGKTASEEHTNTKVEFKAENKAYKSPLHSALGIK
jgi:hypothetical protein